jgi:predicted lysophospholipase L1 biosynthesis ABC-type transport system permease subunit
LQVAVINATAAKRLWPGQSALGKRLRFTPSGPLREVVGVARDGKYVMLAEEPRPFVYVPLTQEYGSPITVHLRAAGETAGLAGALRQLLREMDPDLPIYNVRTMEQHISNSALAAMPLRAGATLAGVQGLLALLLALMGVYSVVAYAVSQRTREIGIRMALGARQFDILSLVIRESLRLTLLGIAIGLGGSVLMSRAVSRFLYGASPTDTLVYLGVAVLLAGAAAMAGYMPARRAARVDPVVALRCE